MANERDPNTPYDPERLDEPTRSYIGERRSPAARDNHLEPAAEHAEGPASSARIAIFAVAIAIVLGAVFYGLNHSSIQQASTAPTPTAANNSAPTSSPATPSGMRDVTPRNNNSASGVTTGAAPAQNPASTPAATPANGGAPASK
jgi:hypothetical protein